MIKPSEDQITFMRTPETSKEELKAMMDALCDHMDERSGVDTKELKINPDEKFPMYSGELIIPVFSEKLIRDFYENNIYEPSDLSGIKPLTMLDKFKRRINRIKSKFIILWKLIKTDDPWELFRDHDE